MREDCDEKNRTAQAVVVVREWHAGPRRIVPPNSASPHAHSLSRTDRAGGGDTRDNHETLYSSSLRQVWCFWTLVGGWSLLALVGQPARLAAVGYIQYFLYAHDGIPTRDACCRQLDDTHRTQVLLKFFWRKRGLQSCMHAWQDGA